MIHADGALMALQAAAENISADAVLKPLATALGLSLFIERAIEMMQNIADILPTTSVGRVLHKEEALDTHFDKLDATVKQAADRETTEGRAEALRAEMTALEQQITAESDTAKKAELETQI